jgi:probable RNA-binding protein EIF1AD
MIPVEGSAENFQHFLPSTAMASRKARLPQSKHQQQVDPDPPSQLESTQNIACVTKINGNGLYTVELPSATELLVELPARFRKAIWVRRGGYVLIDTNGYTEGKVAGEISEVVQEEKSWKKMTYWYLDPRSLLIGHRPKEFIEKEYQPDVSAEETITEDE